MATITETGTIDLKAQKKAHDEAAKTATNYITADSTGITIRMSSSSTTYQKLTATDTTWYTSGKKRSNISADGLKVFIGNAGSEVQVASFGSTARIGKDTEGHVDVTSSGMNVYTDNTTSVASFGSSTRIGSADQAHMLVGSSGLVLYDDTDTEFMSLDGYSSGGNSYGGITVQGAPNVETSIKTLVDGNIKLSSCSTYDGDYGAGIYIRAERLYGTNGSNSDFIEIQMFANDNGRALRINEHTPTAHETLAEFGSFTNWFIKRSDFDSDAYFNKNVYVNGYISSYSNTEVKFAKSPAVYANVNLHGTTIDRSSTTAPSQNVYEDTRTFRIVDVDGDSLVTIRAAQYTTGSIQAQTIAWNTKANGETVYNILSIGIAKDGSQTYSVSSPTNFRNAIGATSGVFPRSAGGTGQSERTSGTVTRTGLSTDGTIAAYSNGVMNTISAGGCKLKTALAASSSVVLATVPEGYRPPMSMFATVCSSAAAGIGRAYVSVKSTGDIEFYTTVAWSTSANIAFTISWAK